MARSSGADMSGCMLWRLPAELREQIFIHAFSPRDDEQKGDYMTNRLDLRIIGDRVFLTPSKSRKYRNRGHHALTLLRTCSAIYAEALPALYAALEFKLILGSPPSRSFYHDELIDIDLGTVKECSLLRRVRKLVFSVELKSEPDADALLEEQLPALIETLPVTHNRHIRHAYIGLFPNVSAKYDWHIFDALRPLLGDRFRRILSLQDHEKTRRFCKTTDCERSTSQSLTRFTAAQIPGSDRRCICS